jgi:hypothetical protein
MNRNKTVVLNYNEVTILTPLYHAAVDEQMIGHVSLVPNQGSRSAPCYD